jgi:periplasmic protein TonB
MLRFSHSLGISVGIHIAAILLIFLIAEYHPATPLPPSTASLADAVAVNIVPPPQPQSPPQPPQPKEPPSKSPLPQPPPQTISTEASQADISTPPPKSIPAPAPPQPPQDYATPLEATYAQIISALLEANKRYPRQALLAGDQGTVVLSFVLNREGTVLAYQIKQSSGQPIFDEAVKRLIQRIHFPPFPKGDLSQRKTFTVPIEFQITG